MKNLTKTTTRRTVLAAGIGSAIALFIAPNTDAASLPALRSGSKGTHVQKLQDDLSSRGIPCGRFGTDGNYGPSTVAAVKEFQGLYGLTKDGVCGPKTWATIVANPKPHPKIIARLSPRWSERGTIAIVDKIGKRGNPAVSNIARIYLFRDGRLIRTIQARTGGKAYNPNDKKWHDKNTPTGNYVVTRKVVDEISRTYGDAKMPYSVYFTHTGIAFHFSSTFRGVNYGSEGNLGSNGCVNIGNMPDAKLLYSYLTVGRHQVLVQQT